MRTKTQHTKDGSVDELLVWNEEGTKHHVYTHRMTDKIVVEYLGCFETFDTIEKAFRFIENDEVSRTIQNGQGDNDPHIRRA